VRGAEGGVVATELGLDRSRADVRAIVGIAAIVGVGSLGLASRAWLAPLAGAVRPLLGLALFASILVASILVPVREGRRSVRPLVAGGIGVAALAGAAIAAGTPVPLAAAAWTLPLSVVAAVAEEALYRRAAYGALERWGAIAAVAGSAALFALAHAPVYGWAVVPVDLGAGLVFGWQRWATGSWGTSAATHVAANVVAVLR
jgi:membrane protease YdiL (CAAX protease family)